MAQFAIEVQFNSIIELTCSGEWGSTACIQGRQSKERRTFRQPTLRNIHFEPVFLENSSFISAGYRGIYILNMFLRIVFSSMWDTHHHHVPVVGCSFHLKSFTKWRLSPNWSHFGKYSTWLFFLVFQIANWVIKRNISFSPACYLDCSPSTQQYSKRIKIILCLIIVFSQEKVPPNMLTLTLVFDISIKSLRDVHF